jgi:hypothetical protein
MSRASTRTANSMSRKSGRSPFLARRSGAATPRSLRLGEMGLRRAWTSAVQRREAVHLRIVCAFRRQVEGSGAEPADTELQLFARIAVVEERLRRALGRARVRRSCVCAASSVRIAPRIRREELR